VIIQCNHCGTSYQYDEARFEGKPSKKIRCAKCREVFEITSPDATGPPAPVTADSGQASDESSFDETRTARRRPKTHNEPLPIAPSTERQDSVPHLPDGMRLSLAIISGPGAGSVFRVEKGRMTIGRAGDIALEDTEASRLHAALEIHDLLFLLEDLGSTNGTLVNGEKIDGLVEIQNHAEFQVGNTTLMLIATADI
jgi:predicted Zn finger-like uncharacterized protein